MKQALQDWRELFFEMDIQKIIEEIESAADVIKADDELTAYLYHCAIGSHHPDVLKALLEHVGKQYEVDSLGLSLLDYAKGCTSQEFMNLLA